MLYIFNKYAIIGYNSLMLPWVAGGTLSRVNALPAFSFTSILVAGESVLVAGKSTIYGGL